MQKLPNAAQALVPLQKITSYLLNERHMMGAPKAAFFKAFGFSIDAPDVLASALRMRAGAVVASATSDIRPISEREIAHSRQVA